MCPPRSAITLPRLPTRAKWSSRQFIDFDDTSPVVQLPGVPAPGNAQYGRKTNVFKLSSRRVPLISAYNDLTRLVLSSKSISDSRTISHLTACVLRKQEIHVISDTIAKLMAENPNPV